MGAELYKLITEMQRRFGFAQSNVCGTVCTLVHRRQSEGKGQKKCFVRTLNLIADPTHDLGLQKLSNIS